jgi:hypothetical protein
MAQVELEVDELGLVRLTYMLRSRHGRSADVVPDGNARTGRGLTAAESDGDARTSSPNAAALGA